MKGCGRVFGGRRGSNYRGLLLSAGAMRLLMKTCGSAAGQEADTNERSGRLFVQAGRSTPCAPRLHLPFSPSPSVLSASCP